MTGNCFGRHMCVGGRSGNEWFFFFFQMFVFILFFKLSYRYTVYIQHVPLILSTLIFLAPMVLLVPLSHRQFSFYFYTICTWAHMYTTHIQVHMSLFIYGNSRHRDSQHGGKHLSLVRSTVNHNQIKEHKGGNAPFSLDPNHLSVIHYRWAEGCLGVL